MHPQPRRPSRAPLRFRHKLEIGTACLLVPCLLELAPASRVFRWIRRVPRRRAGPVPPERLALHVDRLLHRAPGLWRYTCLRRAAVLAALLRRNGRAAEVVIGVRRALDGGVEAHAWLACDGEEPYLEPGGAGPVSGFERLRAAAE